MLTDLIVFSTQNPVTGPVVATAVEGSPATGSAAGSAATTTFDGGASTGTAGAEVMFAAGAALLAVVYAQ